MGRLNADEKTLLISFSTSAAFHVESIEIFPIRPISASSALIAPLGIAIMSAFLETFGGIQTVFCVNFSRFWLTCTRPFLLWFLWSRAIYMYIFIRVYCCCLFSYAVCFQCIYKPNRNMFFSKGLLKFQGLGNLQSIEKDASCHPPTLY